MTRIDEEIAYLRGIYPALEYKPDGRWVRIPGYRIIVAGWTPAELDVCFQIADAYPAPPYGFYVPAGIKFNGATPNSYKEPAPNQPPYFGTWGILSWQPEDGHWHPGATVESGSNLTDWVRRFAKRFEEGL